MRMGLDKQEPRKHQDEPENPARRDLLKFGVGALAAGAVAAVGGSGLVKILEEKERLHTLTGKALILKKFTSKPSVGEAGLSALAIGGIGPAIIEAGKVATGIGEPMEQRFFLLIKIDQREEQVIPIGSSIYKRIEQGDELPIEYVTSEDGKEITKIKSLEPVR